MLANASYFAFTATPKNKTLEMFGEPLPPDAEGKVKHRPFHSYTMKQAIDEDFILDVLKAYTPVDSYYKLVKKTEDDPECRHQKAKKKLRRYVESHDHAIRLKARSWWTTSTTRSGGREDRRTGARDGGDERHRASDSVLPCLQEHISRRQEPAPGNRRLLGRARLRWREGQRGFSQRLFQAANIADKIQTAPYAS